MEGLWKRNEQRESLNILRDNIIFIIFISLLILLYYYIIMHIYKGWSHNPIKWMWEIEGESIYNG